MSPCRLIYTSLIASSILFSLPHSTRGQYPEIECLIAFRASVQDRSNLLSSYWPDDLYSSNASSSNYSGGVDVCNLHGVSCWSQPARPKEIKILAISLQTAGLSGDPFPPGLAKCSTSLQTLILSDNSFSGPLPSQLCQWLPYLTSLDLSRNQFSGVIPSSLKDCVYLNNLQLHHNLFTGQIPWELATISHLLQLDLSHNLLSGPVPAFSYRNCSRYTCISALDFQGNPQLCGPPLPSPCSPHRSFTVDLLPLKIASGFFLLFLLIALIAYRQYLRQQVISSKRGTFPTSVKTFDPNYLRLSWQSLEQATSGFNHANILGVGGSATVYKGQLPNDQMIAIKLLQKEDNISMSCDVQKQFFTELEVLGKLRHRNLVRILGYYYNGLDTMAIILDFMPMGSLEALLHSHSSTLPQTILGSHRMSNNQLQQLAHRPKVDWATCYRILVGIAEGLAYLHHEYDGKRCIVHGDLKPGNVLLDAELEAHIADFGLARMVRATNTASIPSSSSRQREMSNVHWWSFGYTAPECAQQGVVSRKTDVFSFGVLVLEVLTGERPSSAKLEEGQTLADWVGKALALNMNGAEAVVAALGLKDDEGNMNWKKEYWAEAEMIVAALKIGCRCASYQASARPDMHLVLALLHDILATHMKQERRYSATSSNEDELWMLSRS